MRASQVFALYCLATSTISASSLPDANANALDLLEAHGASIPRSEILASEHALEKRKGGGGKGGGGSGGGKSGGGGTGGTGRSSPSSNVGGATRQGSGPARSYGGGYYGGGASTPYASGKSTPKGLAPGLLLGGAALFIFPGIWLYSVWPYSYVNPYRFRNESFQNATQQGLNQTLPVVCLCQEYSVCGCDENNDQNYLNDLVGNGSYAALNKTLVTVSEVNGTRSLVLNGTLPNGTTAPGGEDDAEEGAAPGLVNALPFGKFTGYYAIGAITLYAVALL
ncbi:hypothetical protein K505DRAFT_371738 [Melanomma pulvis-pyrius CBS 109.77]|uniref:DUF7732 domain-containing protein n=1 Tax=Melanomma pulvis-pyrius CBS 109.77 TaxID=1314802 RepID=A0A6A6XS94_9PLEO|nr:hypothetical protein K505DRAFT_371738 [Melanomma pulvis-pyrius CBS 109.77]